MSDNFPPGFYGSMRVRLPLFALVAVGTVLIGIVPFPHHARREILIADLVFILILTLAFLLPWERLPDWAWLILPVGYIGVIALIRNAQGNSDFGLETVYLLPIIWLALYGRRAHIVLGLFFLDLALLIPVLVIRHGDSLSEWRQVIIMGVVTTIVASTVSTMVNRDRAYVSNLARQSALAERSALDAGSARDRLETLLRAATGSAIMGVDPAGTVTFFSAGAEQMLGYSAAEVVGQHSIADFIDPAQIDERRQTIHALHLDTAAANGAEGVGGSSGNRSTASASGASSAGSNGGPPPLDPEVLAEVPWTATRKDGQQRRCVVRVRALPAEPVAAAENDGGPGSVASGSGESINAGYVVVAIDVTEREELAAERERLYTVQKEVTQSLVEQNNRLRELTQMKDDVVATVSHELRTPITSIRGFVELLLDESAALGDDQLKMLRTIERNAEHLQRVAEDLLADPGGGHGLRVAFTELDLFGLAGDAVDACQTSARRAGVSVELAPGSMVPIYGDPTRLHQLIGNLLSNAIKFSPRGGRVQVAVDEVDTFARVQVLDDGPGIPLEDRAQLFERFYRLASTMDSVPGTGLGLAIAKSVAEAHEGFVDIVDTPGWSTTFRVFLPLRTSASSSVSA